MLVPEFRISHKHVRLTAVRPMALQYLDLKQREVRPHDHTYFELTLIVSGCVIHHANDMRYRAGPGAVLVLAPEEVHGYSPDPDSETCHLWNLYYFAEWLLLDLPLLWREPYLVDLFFGKQLFPRLQRRSVPEFELNAAEFTQVLAELALLKAELDLESPSLVYIKSLLIKVLVVLARAYGRVADGRERFVFRTEVWALLERVDVLIRSGEKLDLEQEAKALKMSRDHLARIFSDATGSTPTEFFQERRIQVACVRLLDERVGITELAYELGYSDAAHFSRLFKQHRGVSPRAYRLKFEM